MPISSEEEVEESSPSHNDSSDSNNNTPNDIHMHNPLDEEVEEEGLSPLSGSASEDYSSTDGDDDDHEHDRQDHMNDGHLNSNNNDNNPHRAPHPQFSQHTFAPPFYGRPPTPLPPSPSLTSLLRPSRPTTPDASDDEHSEPLPRARPKVPTYEYYGFVLYLFSSLSFLIYLLWSYLPSPFLHALGIYYYPNRWWSLAVPSFIVMLLVYIYVALACYNVEVLTLPLGSIETVVDDAAQVAVVDSKGRIKAGRRRERRRQQEMMSLGLMDRETKRELVLPGGTLNWKEVWNEGTDAVMDVPLAGVCEVLYANGGGEEDDEEEDGEVVIRRV
ncbi:meiotically up-regulated gene 84 protein [Podospora australis]|uniref:Meiotically up-regulated gene 84 protein n=1 Tax=Podospora australis TaxID=1536484 RepID=A0AAN6X700_9PEZI|nr:meiotically up-regulated gene 84 protein [Podospora australis]